MGHSLCGQGFLTRGASHHFAELGDKSVVHEHVPRTRSLSSRSSTSTERQSTLMNSKTEAKQCLGVSTRGCGS